MEKPLFSAFGCGNRGFSQISAASPAAGWELLGFIHYQYKIGMGAELQAATALILSDQNAFHAFDAPVVGAVLHLYQRLRIVCRYRLNCVLRRRFSGVGRACSVRSGNTQNGKLSKKRAPKSRYIGSGMSS